MAIQLPDGRMVTGKTSELMGCSAAALLNALKSLAGLGGHGVHLIAQSAIEPIQTVKVKYLGSNNPRLHSDEVLIALAASANLDPKAARALEALAASSGLSGPLLRHPVPRRRGDLPQAGHPAHLRAQVSDQQALSPISAKRRPREKDLPGALVLF